MKDKLKTIIKKVVKPVGRLLSLLSVIFVIYSVYKLGFDFGSIDNIPFFAIISLAGILIKCATVFVMGDAWADWLKLLSKGRAFDKKEARAVYAKANIGKYLPGNVMHYVERNLFASDLGISQQRIALSSVAEIVCQLAAAFIMALLTSYRFLLSAAAEVFGGKNIIYIVIMAVALSVFLWGIFVFRKKVKALFGEFGAKSFLKTLITTLIKYMLTLWLLGFIMAVLYGYMSGNTELHTSNLIISCYVIAWVLGFVTPGASGGIGVREVVIIFLLGPVVGKDLVLTLSVVHRLITIIGDFLCYFYVILINRSKK